MHCKIICYVVYLIIIEMAPVYFEKAECSKTVKCQASYVLEWCQVCCLLSLRTKRTIVLSSVRYILKILVDIFIYLLFLSCNCVVNPIRRQNGHKIHLYKVSQVQ